MTEVFFNFGKFVPGEIERIDSGIIRFKPNKRVSVGDYVVMPDPFQVKFGKESFSVDLHPNTAEWAWEISVASRFSGYYNIVDTGLLQFSRLKPLDPATMTEGEPDPAWWQKLNDLIEVGGLPGTIIHTGNGEPQIEGRPGDMYIDVTTGTLYTNS